ncbi:MAG: DUF4198 domain-containing protein [Phycisphaerales bacterium]|nr:DUF4198 domain-containing protein [Phycisphaerales bacterium]
MIKAITWPMMMVLVLALAAPAWAHDFWIRPSSYAPTAATLVSLDLRIGDDYPGEVFRRKDSMIERFVAISPDGTEAPVVGLDGRAPAGALRIESPGSHIVVYRGKHATVQLESAKFEDYLREEGLEKIIEARKKAGESDKPGLEMYSRCAKSIIFARGSESDAAPVTTGFDRVVGLRLELVPITDPAAAKPAEEFQARLLLDGKPCSGVLVGANCVEDARARVRGRTGENGEVKLKLSRAGTWVLNAVEMLPAPTDTAANPTGCKWESLWASLSFEVVEPPAKKTEPK